MSEGTKLKTVAGRCQGCGDVLETDEFDGVGGHARVEERNVGSLRYATYEPVQIQCGPVDDLTPLLPAQEALAQAEARVRELEAEVAGLRSGLKVEGETHAATVRHLERLRPVVRAAYRYALDPDALDDALDALPPEERAWAEGDS